MLEFVEFVFSEMLLMSKMKPLLMFSWGWEELTQRSDNGCFGIVEGPPE